MGSTSCLNILQERIDVFPWNDQYNTDIPEIDAQHKKLVELLNDLAGKLVEDDPTQISQALEEVVSYAEYHFECEERIWQEVFQQDDMQEDAWFLSHQGNHESFLPAIEKMRKEQHKLPLPELVEKLVRFLVRWLIFHIIDDDLCMARVYRYVGEGTPLWEAKLRAKEEGEDASRILIDVILNMYETISAHTMALMRERSQREKAEAKLQVAYDELKKLAITDKLTGLYNRHHFEQIFDGELKRAMRDKKMLSFIMLDIDHFKMLNDHYGHAKGDEALETIGGKLQALCRRPTDFVFRLGGEEFGILSVEETDHASAEFAEIIRADIEKLGFPNQFSKVSDVVTVSLGVVSKTPTSEDSLDDFMTLADNRLYKAKNAGRNCVVAA